MKKTAIAIATASMFLIAGPAVAGDDKEKNQAQTQSQTGQSTNMGQTAGNTGQGAMGTNQNFQDLDRNQDGNLDEEELNTFGSTAAGTDTGAESDRGARNLEFYDEDRNENVSEEEFNRRNQSGAGGSMGTGSGTGGSGGGTQ